LLLPSPLALPLGAGGLQNSIRLPVVIMIVGILSLIVPGEAVTPNSFLPSTEFGSRRGHRLAHG